MLKLVGVKKYYQIGTSVVKALDGIDLEISEGEFVAIVGPSGSGKSTMMNILGCLDVATSGAYFIDETDVSRLKDN